MPQGVVCVRDASRAASTRQVRAPYNVFANGPLSACICPPPERSPSCRLQPPTSVQSAIATPTSAACYGPPPNPQASPDLQETARSMPASSYAQTRTLLPIWESSVSARTLAGHLNAVTAARYRRGPVRWILNSNRSSSIVGGWLRSWGCPNISVPNWCGGLGVALRRVFPP